MLLRRGDTTNATVLDGPVGFLAMHLARFRGHACAGGRLRVWPLKRKHLSLRKEHRILG